MLAVESLLNTVRYLSGLIWKYNHSKHSQFKRKYFLLNILGVLGMISMRVDALKQHVKELIEEIEKDGIPDDPALDLFLDGSPVDPALIDDYK